MKTITEDYCINWWLEKYHGTNLDEVFKLHPDWTYDNPEYRANMFYSSYQVTQDQHDEWYDAIISELSKEHKTSKKRMKRDFVFSYLNTAPMVKL